MGTAGALTMADRKDSTRKVSTQRKLSAISVADDVSGISNKLGMEQDPLRSIMQDIIELDLNNNWELGSEYGLSEYGEDGHTDDMSLWQELRNETVRLDVRKDSCTSQISTDSLDRAEDFTPVEINLKEVQTVLNLYHKHKTSVGALTGYNNKM